MQPRKIEKLTILGLGVTIYDWVTHTYKDPGNGGEVWTINAGGFLFRHDILWDMHTPEWLADMEPKGAERALKRRACMRVHDKPIVMPKADPEFPSSITYPLRLVVEKTNSLYFATSIAYMLAWAYVCNVDKLQMFGCDFSYARDTNTHPDEQGRACCEYWVGRLIERGTKVGVSNNTHFLDMHRRSNGRIYGYHEQVTMDFPNDGGKAVFVGPDYSDAKSIDPAEYGPQWTRTKKRLAAVNQ